MNRPRILVSNDDGIDSPGLHALVAALTDVGVVTVAAPSADYSGAGTAIGDLKDGLPDLHDRTVDGAVSAFAVDGPPSFCALMGVLGAFGPTPQIVVSGVNAGWNVGQAVHFSGTIGVTLCAAVNGVAGVAVSQHRARGDETQHWETAARAAAEAARLLVTGSWSSPAPVLNLNVDNIAMSEVNGLRQGHVSSRVPFSMESAAIVPGPGSTHGLSYRSTPPGAERADGSARAHVDAGFIAATWLQPVSAVDEPSPGLLDGLRTALGFESAP